MKLSFSSPIARILVSSFKNSMNVLFLAIHDMMFTIYHSLWIVGSKNFVDTESSFVSRVHLSSDNRFLNSQTSFNITWSLSNSSSLGKIDLCRNNPLGFSSPSNVFKINKKSYVQVMNLWRTSTNRSMRKKPMFKINPSTNQFRHHQLAPARTREEPKS